jgi:hypothetical protein
MNRPGVSARLGAVDPPPFVWLQDVITTGALYVATHMVRIQVSFRGASRRLGMTFMGVNQPSMARVSYVWIILRAGNSRGILKLFRPMWGVSFLCKQTFSQ